MRGEDRVSGSLFSYVDLDARVPAKHPLRAMRDLVNNSLAATDASFSALYKAEGRPSIPPELAQPQVKNLLSADHFSVDGTMLKAWASMKSVRPKDGSGEPPAPGRNG